MRVFFFFSTLGPFYGAVAQMLRHSQPQLRFSGVVYNRISERQVRNSGLPSWDYVGVFSRFRESRRRDTEADLAYLERVEAEYAMPNLPLMVYGDRFLTKFSRHKQLQVVEDAARFLEEALERTAPDVIVSEGVDCLLSYLLYGMARRHGIPFHVIFAGRLAGRMAIVSNHEDRWELAEDIYHQLVASDLTQAQRGRAEEFLSDFRQRRPRATQAVYPFATWLRRWDAQALIDVVRTQLTDREDYVYGYTNPVKLVANRLRRMARSAVAEKTIFQQPRRHEKFVLFPLQFQPEATTLVLAPYYEDQVPLIENIAKSLPIGYWLYVKEHPYSVGRRPLGDYRRLDRLTNVRLISPYVSSHDLIQRAQAIATINSTMGLEGILYEKPVISFGHAFYNMFDQVYPVRDIYRLPWIVTDALQRFNPNQELLLKFVTAVLEGTHPGETIYPICTASPELWRQSVSDTAVALTEVLGLATPPVAHTADHLGALSS